MKNLSIIFENNTIIYFRKILEDSFFEAYTEHEDDLLVSIEYYLTNKCNKCETELSEMIEPYFKKEFLIYENTDISFQSKNIIAEMREVFGSEIIIENIKQIFNNIRTKYHDWRMRRNIKKRDKSINKIKQSMGNAKDSVGEYMDDTTNHFVNGKLYRGLYSSLGGASSLGFGTLSNYLRARRALKYQARAKKHASKIAELRGTP